MNKETISKSQRMVVMKQVFQQPHPSVIPLNTPSALLVSVIIQIFIVVMTMLFPQMKLRSNSAMSDLSLGLYKTPILVWPFPASQLHCSSILDTASISSPGLRCGFSQPDLQSNSGIPEPYPVLVETPNLVWPLLDPDQSPSSIPVVTSISSSGLLLLCSVLLLAQW